METSATEWHCSARGSWAAPLVHKLAQLLHHARDIAGGGSRSPVVLFHQCFRDLLWRISGSYQSAKALANRDDFVPDVHNLPFGDRGAMARDQQIEIQFQ